MSKKDLISIADRTPEEREEIARMGGKKSGEVRRKKKLMSQIYAEFLIKEHDIKGSDGLPKKVSGTQLLNSVMSKVLSRGDSSSVSLLREIREATEGSRINLKTENIEDVISEINNIFDEEFPLEEDEDIELEDCSELIEDQTDEEKQD